MLDLLVTRTCAPAAWEDRLGEITFTGRRCESQTDPTIDVAVVYTRAARDAAGGAAAIEAEIDLLIAETNQAYAASGVRHRVALVERSEVSYAGTATASSIFSASPAPPTTTSARCTACATGSGPTSCT